MTARALPAWPTIERDHATALRINNLRDFTIARGIKWTAEHDELAAGLHR